MTSRDDLSRSFGREAGTYEQGRPDYQPLAVAWMLEQVADRTPMRVADVGAGTGKLARVVQRLGAQVVAVDPDPRMLAGLNAAVPGVPTFLGTAEALPLPDASVDAVVLGQAWHWVDVERACREIGRVLRPGGTLGLIWNVRDESVDWVARITDITESSHAELLLATSGPMVAEPFGELEHRTWRWARSLDRSALFAMVRSRSAYLTAGDSAKALIDARLGELFDQVGAVGDALVDLPYVTHVHRTTRP